MSGSTGGPLPLAAAIVCPEGAIGPIRALVERLSNAGVTVDVVDEIAEAADFIVRADRPAALILDCRAMATDDPQDLAETTELLRRCRGMLPTHRPIIVVSSAPNSFIVAAFRAGAGDVIDMALEGTTHVRTVVARACSEMVTRRTERDQTRELRAVAEGFMRELIRTERQKIDLEEKLAAPKGERAGAARSPVVLLVEDDPVVANRLTLSLEEKGITTFAFFSGEDAVHEAISMDSTAAGFDLALVDLGLPGMDGLETISQLRAAVPGLASFLMATERERDRLHAATEADIVGYVMKPFENFDALTTKLGALARDTMLRNQELHYLQRIKTRHASILERFLAIPQA